MSRRDHDAPRSEEPREYIAGAQCWVDMWRLALLVVLVACGSPQVASPPQRPGADSAPVPDAQIAATAPVDDAPRVRDVTTPDARPVTGDDASAGAVPIPDDTGDRERTLDLKDTTVTLAELPLIGAAWTQRKTLRYRGVVPFALHIRIDQLTLSVVSSEVGPSGYPGAREMFDLATIARDQQPPGGNAFSGFAVPGEEPPAIRAAVRLLPSAGAPESERRQYVVYVPPERPSSILVATKRVTDVTWTPLLRADVPRATRVDFLNPGWH